MLKNLCNIKNGKLYKIEENGDNILYNGGKKTYKTNEKSNLEPDKEYIIIHKQSGSVSLIRKEEAIKSCIGNNAIYLRVKDECEKQLLNRFLYYSLVAKPHIIKQLQHGSNQLTIKISDIEKITCGFV